MQAVLKRGEASEQGCLGVLSSFEPLFNEHPGMASKRAQSQPRSREPHPASSWCLLHMMIG